MSYMGFINELTNHKKPYMRSLTGNPKTQTFKKPRIFAIENQTNNITAWDVSCGG